MIIRKVTKRSYPRQYVTAIVALFELNHLLLSGKYLLVFSHWTVRYLNWIFVVYYSIVCDLADDSVVHFTVL